MPPDIIEVPLPGKPLDDASSPPEKSSGAAGLRSFVAGPENHLVQLAVASLLDDLEPAYSPLVIHGPPGTGKSHLALGVVAAWKSRYPRRPAIYAAAIDFARDLADAIETQTADEFILPYRKASLLVIEDLQHVADKPTAQAELVITLDAVAELGGRILVTASTARHAFPASSPPWPAA